MKHREIYALCLSLFLLAFACLLFTGAPRLIAAGDDAPKAFRRDCRLFLCSAQSSAVQSSEAEAARRQNTVQRMDAALVLAYTGANSHVLPGTDANGNVLSSVSYMRSVYQVFALGDGFA